MYSIVINNITVEFESTLSMVENSSIFSDEISGYSLQFTLPNTEVNRRAHGFNNLPQSASNQEKELPCIINTDTRQLLGTVISKFQNGSFTDYFKLSGDFFGAVKDKKLADIPFDIESFFLHYGDMRNNYIAYRINDSCNRPFSFPIVYNSKTADKSIVKVDFGKYLNSIPADGGTGHYPVTPFIHLHYIVKSLFEKYGIECNDNVFNSNYSFLKRLCYANNYLLNEFEINKAVQTETPRLVSKVAASKDPVVTCTSNHQISQYGLIIIKDANPAWNNRVFQIEVVDAVSFKILGEDFSEATEYVMQYHVSSVECTIEGSVSSYTITLSEELSQAAEMIKYFNTGTFKLAGNYAQGDKSFQLVYENDILVKNKLFYSSNTQNEGDRSADWTDSTLYYLGTNLTNQNTGTIQRLGPMECYFRQVNPANHMPDIKIADFLKDLEALGIFAFINSTSAELFQIKDILNSLEAIDISSFTEEIKDIENPGLNGYALKMTSDSSDEYLKTMLPVTSLDPKYTMKASVSTKADLPYAGSETNDVRLVTSENSLYVFNKSFLNADNNWKFLCFNNIDKSEGEGQFAINAKFSPVLTDRALRYARYDVPATCKTFFDSTLKCNPRLLMFYNINSTPFATSETTDPTGTEIPGAKLAIRWDTDKGIYNVLLKEYIEWQLRIRKDVSTTVHWPMEHFANFKFSKKYRIRGVDYLVKSIKYSIDFKNQRIVFNETELAKV